MKIFFRAILIVFLGVLCCGCGKEEPERFENADVAFGTVIQQILYTAGDGEREAEEILALLRKLEEERLSRRLADSEVSRVNRTAGAEEGCLLSPELETAVEECLEVWERSGGAFDITLGELAALWDIDGWAAGEREGEFIPPEEESLREALVRSGSGKLRLEDGRIFLSEGMSLDLGAVGKGIAMEEILGKLQEEENITGAIISLGGSILTYGGKPDGTDWRVAVRDPLDGTGNAGVLSLEGQWCVSTSGDYERYAEKDGIRYHHILDPATGYPANSGVAGVTVLSKDGFLSDALSTACFILGPEKGIPLAESYGAEILFIKKDGSLEMSGGMRRYFSRE
ncbi:MAG: FAD:protein FMN transferase [Roseburia sp.]|nr:FAD:protein FMN transferase [Roseburia sp.]MCM1099012.1 FAD:protein FMN transferase [Ruminococcus flavefaciens]